MYKYHYLRDYLHTSANNQDNETQSSETKYKRQIVHKIKQEVTKKCDIVKG